MAPRTGSSALKGLPPPGPARGYPVVLGPRSSYHRYQELPWTAIVEAARFGRDGLRLAIEGQPDADPAFEEFVLREMTVGPSSTFYGRASLLQQNW